MERTAATSTVLVGDRELTLRLDFNAIAAFEKVAGKDFFAWIVELESRGRPSVSDLRALVFGCVTAAESDRDGQPTSSLAEIGALLNLSNFEVLSAALGELVGSAMPDATADPTPSATGPDPGEEIPSEP